MMVIFSADPRASGTVLAVDEDSGQVTVLWTTTPHPDRLWASELSLQICDEEDARILEDLIEKHKMGVITDDR